MRIKSALVSVSDKSGIVEFCKELSKNGVKIISSGGTHKLLQGKGIKCSSVEETTHFPEMLEGRLKTLHPAIHGGILAKRNKDHLSQLKEHKIEPIDLVIVNLYSFKETVSKKGVKLEDAIENIDIGGPALIRAAAKNHESVGVVVDPAQYPKVLEDLKANSFALSEKMKKELCAEAFAHTAFYDSLIAQYLGEKYLQEKFPQKLTLALEKRSTLRYGENPHQEAALYRAPLRGSGSVIDAVQLNGKELSYNNCLDSDTAIAIVRDFDVPCAAIIKHNNPCGAAVSAKIKDAFLKAYECDPLSAFGGVIALNKACDLETAKKITSFFNEVVIAPAYKPEALEELKKKQNLRVLELRGMEKPAGTGLGFRQIFGGMLAQDSDVEGKPNWENRSGAKADKGVVADLEFAWKIVKHVKSNAIVLAKEGATVGIGMGLTSRVDAAELAIRKAGPRAKGSVMASDAFFPFKDSIEAAAEAGVVAAAEPGGSVKDSEVVAEAKKRGIALFFTGYRHFRH